LLNVQVNQNAADARMTRAERPARNRPAIIGIVGGLSWEATALYYRLLNETAERRHGTHRNARSIVVTVEFAEILALVREGRWPAVAEILVAAAQTLERAGAACVLLAANTAHAVADEVGAAIKVPLLHIADAAAGAIRAAGHRRVGLIGTRAVTGGAFYAKRLAERHGIETVTPDEAASARIEAIIFDELTAGRFLPESKAFVLGAVADLARAGADGVVVGCTELPLLIRQDDTATSLYDTARLHVEAALDLAATL
jgi:aspartate racemase